MASSHVRVAMVTNTAMRSIPTTGSPLVETNSILVTGRATLSGGSENHP